MDDLSECEPAAAAAATAAADAWNGEFGSPRTRLSERTRGAIGDHLAAAGRLPRRSARLFVGPAVIASTAYMDPGNFTVNIQAGARYGYALLWVVLLANAMAMLFQALSAKLGIVTGRNLAELCRDRFPRRVVWGMWAVSELAAMATDLAEFLGGAIGLALLLDLPLMGGMAITAVATYAFLVLDRSGFRPMEIIIGGFVAAIGLCYLIEVVIAPLDWLAAGSHLLIPRLRDTQALALAVGIIGATVMPHALYLHSGLTQARVMARNEAERRRLLRFSNREVVFALGIAGAINLAMVMMAAAAFRWGHADVGSIETAYRTLGPLLGKAAAGAFLLSLIASGLSSSVVGTLAGQIVMQGFIARRIPIWVRRLVTMAPAFAVVGAGIDATTALVLSQILLSLALPVPMIALVLFTRRRDIMGPLANRPLTDAAAIAATALVLTLNLVLLVQSWL